MDQKVVQTMKALEALANDASTTEAERKNARARLAEFKEKHRVTETAHRSDMFDTFGPMSDQAFIDIIMNIRRARYSSGASSFEEHVENLKNVARNARRQRTEEFVADYQCKVRKAAEEAAAERTKSHKPEVKVKPKAKQKSKMFNPLRAMEEMKLDNKDLLAFRWMCTECAKRWVEKTVPVKRFKESPDIVKTEMDRLILGYDDNRCEVCKHKETL